MYTAHIHIIAAELNLPGKKVESTLKLLGEGATVPFIARYRKEATGGLDEVQIAEIQREGRRLSELEKRRETILNSIAEQGKLTEELRRRITATYSSTELEDIYLPYKPKRRTRGTMAKEKGLEPLALAIFEQAGSDPTKVAARYLNEAVASVAEALQGARDIMAEWMNEDEMARTKVRYAFGKEAVITAKVARGKEEEGSKYRDYFDFSEPLKKCPSHRLLAIRRGEEEGILRVIIEPAEEAVLPVLERLFVKAPDAAGREVKEALHDAYRRLLSPGIETEFRQSSKELADKEAIGVFAENLRQLLLAAPLGQKRLIGLDPGYRSGCKLVCLDEAGQLLFNTTLYPHPPQSDEHGAAATLRQLVERYGIEAIAVGNGTAGRETMAFCQRVPFEQPVAVFLVNENGASIYSASDIAREEFPEQDLTVRGAVSIARRLMDPLAELVKIDPKSIGVGQYQHDVNQNRLKERLDEVVEHCVNAVGINVNTASKHLLTYVSGLGPVLAQNIVAHRSEHGPFASRAALKKVARMGEKSFEQSAGFLRIREAANPLDNTAVHPESYPVVVQMAKDLGASVEELIRSPELRSRIELPRYASEQVGLPTLRDILRELSKPGLDPRGSAKSFEFAKGVHDIRDLSPGMVLPGIVNNITNFGAFVDIGVKESGLVHVSQLADKFVKNPLDVVSLQQEVMVRVVEVDVPRKRIQLSMKGV